MDANGGIEIESKFDVDELAPLPRLNDLPGVQVIAEPMTFDLEAVYFDTNDLVLSAEHITLRRRTGGDDAGWHLKLPDAAGRRREIHAPLGKNVQREADVVPTTRSPDYNYTPPVAAFASTGTASRLRLGLLGACAVAVVVFALHLFGVF